MRAVGAPSPLPPKKTNHGGQESLFKVGCFHQRSSKFVIGYYIPDSGSTMLDHWSRILYPGSLIQDPGSKILNPGSRVQDHGSRILFLDPGSRIRESGSWILVQDPVSRNLNRSQSGPVGASRGQRLERLERLQHRHVLKFDII